MKMLTSVFVAVCCALRVVPAAEPSVTSDWTELFNGKDLAGWVQKGGAAKFRAEDNQIVGSTVPDTGNSFLCTTREYADFIFELEFKIDPGLNSGVQIRSRAAEQETTEDWNGKSVKIPAGRVHGMQVEIDQTPRAWTGGIYGEGIGWLHDLKTNEAARQAFKHGEWNKFRIEANGPTIKTWINGIAAADLKNDVIPRGFIGLQVHGVGKTTETLEVRFRHLRLKEQPERAVLSDEKLR